MHINGMLLTGNIRCYADDSTDEYIHYTGRAIMSGWLVHETKRDLLVAPPNGANSILLILKTQICAFAAKKIQFR